MRQQNTPTPEGDLALARAVFALVERHYGAPNRWGDRCFHNMFHEKGYWHSGRWHNYFCRLCEIDHKTQCLGRTADPAGALRMAYSQRWRRFARRVLRAHAVRRLVGPPKDKPLDTRLGGTPGSSLLTNSK